VGDGVESWRGTGGYIYILEFPDSEESMRRGEYYANKKFIWIFFARRKLT
jgi:transcriptional regulator CtsR